MSSVLAGEVIFYSSYLGGLRTDWINIMSIIVSFLGYKR